ncbi:MAG: recombinase family protein [Cyanobacteria bacterium]|nr:recombinase family protein [Cyanobacteriota bacterium]
MDKYFIYCRKSSDSEDRQMLSIEAQLQELRDYARKEKLEIVREFTESKTAKKPGREIFNEMISEIEAGKADGIVAWNPDRLARNSVDGGRIIYLIDEAVIKDLKFPTAWFDNSPQGKFNLSIAFGQAKFYVDNLRQNVHRGIRQKLRKGQYCNKAPLGYINHPKTRTIEPDPVEFDLMRKTFDLFLTGNCSQTEIRQAMFEMGIKNQTGDRIHRDKVKKTLQNPFYYGYSYHKGELYEASHQPMITKAEHEEVQRILKLKSKNKYKTTKKDKKKRDFFFLGFEKCGECGCSFTAERHEKKKYNAVWKYYRCSKKKKDMDCDQPYLKEEILSGQVKDTVSRIALSDDWSELALKTLDSWADTERQSSLKTAKNLESDLKIIREKLERLLDLHLDGVLSSGEYKSKKNALISSKLKLETQLSQIKQDGVVWLEPSKTLIKEANRAKKLVEEENYHEMRSLLQKAGSNQLIRDRKFSMNYLEPWNFLIELNSSFLLHSSQSYALTELPSENALVGWAGIKKSPRSGQPIRGSECQLAAGMSEWCVR